MRNVNLRISFLILFLYMYKNKNADDASVMRVPVVYISEYVL